MKIDHAKFLFFKHVEFDIFLRVLSKNPISLDIW